jgi:hypothetical protein
MSGKKEQLASSACLLPELLLRYVTQPEELSEEQCEAISWHIAQCEHCAGEYESLCEANTELWEKVVQAAGIPEKPPIAIRTAEEALCDFWQRIDDEDDIEFSSHFRRHALYRIGKIVIGLAACITLGLLTVWAVRNRAFSKAAASGPSGRCCPGYH